jgi:tetratricopeptide (TPR) repeat protein
MADEFFSIESAASSADQAMARGRFADAVVHYRMLVAQTHVVDYEYDEWLRRLADCYGRLGRSREAGWVQLYLHYFDLAMCSFAIDEAVLDRARALALQKRWAEAADAFWKGGARVQAGVALEEAGDVQRAREVWAGLLSSGRLRERPYEKALCCFNLGMASRRLGGDDGVRHLVEAQRVLEQVADDFETRGERERAFDCYLILLKLGKDSGQFENLSEGYLNCIRVLREDGLKFYVLQFYEDFVKLALGAGELHAAATLYREAADYSARVGLPYHRAYLRRAAETWWRAAEKSLTVGAPVELAENAFLAAVDCASTVGDFARVRETYGRLAGLDLGEKKQKRYAAIAARFAGAPEGGGAAPEFPEYLKQPHAYTDIWFVDLVEWEMDGDPEQVAQSIVGDLRFPDGFRRRALNVVLTMADARRTGSAENADTLVRVAEALGELQSYAALRPLEKLYEHADARVRRAAVRALRYLHFKRSFVLIGKALADREPVVREAAVQAMQNLHFPHAFHPLARIFREGTDEKVKTAALETIGRIGSIEAGEMLLGILRHEGGALRQVARKALLQLDNPDVAPIIRQITEVEQNPEVRKVLDELLQRARRR